MILTYKMVDDKERWSVWERDTNTNKERCVYDSKPLPRQSYSIDYKEWIEFTEGKRLPDMMKESKHLNVSIISRISRADALLEMI